MESYDMRVAREIWKALRRADPTALREFFGSKIHYLELRAYFHSFESRSVYLPSNAERVQGRKDRPMHKEQ